MVVSRRKIEFAFGTLMRFWKWVGGKRILWEYGGVRYETEECFVS